MLYQKIRSQILVVQTVVFRVYLFRSQRTGRVMIECVSCYTVYSIYSAARGTVVIFTSINAPSCQLTCNGNTSGLVVSDTFMWQHTSCCISYTLDHQMYTLSSMSWHIYIQKYYGIFSTGYIQVLGDLFLGIQYVVVVFQPQTLCHTYRPPGISLISFEVYSQKDSKLSSPSYDPESSIKLLPRIRLNILP